VFRGDPRYGGSPLPLEYSVAHYAWQKYCRKAEIQATIHQLRHSRASQLLQAGVPVTTVRKQLGQRNIQSTLLYAEVDQATIKHDLLRPEGVITQVSKQLGLSPSLLEQQRNHPSLRSATFEAVRVYFGLLAFKEAVEGRLRAYLMEKVTHTGNYAAL